MAKIDIENTSSVVELFTKLIETYKPTESIWYKNYKNLVKTIKNEDVISDETLKEIWFTRDNPVTSLRQGAPSYEEFEQCKGEFRNITEMFKVSTTNEVYNLAIERMQKLKAEHKANKMYLALLNRVVAGISPSECTTTLDNGAFTKICTFLSHQFDFVFNPNDNWFLKNQAYLKFLHENLPAEWMSDPILINTITWELFTEVDDYKNKIDDKNKNHVEEPNLSYDIKEHKSASQPLNQILYGPPGTGKTYKTIEAAVKAAEPTFTWNNRIDLKAKYDALVYEKQIRFVTFHQSYSYEEFVEGVSAKTENNQVVYYDREGVFKNICKDAKAHQGKSVIKQSESFPICWDNLFEQFEKNGEQLEIKSTRSKFVITDITETTIRFDKEQGDSKNTLSIKTLEAIFNKEREIKGGLQPYYSALVNHLKNLVPNEQTLTIKQKNYVLIIDEINRGNVSKIFGELITLIEESKRLGRKETIPVELPVSGDLFAVPDNLYIIGTMNTADRSLTTIDTALRRRFDFVEMMPAPAILENVMVKGIDLTQLLTALNQRIEVLYDREHTLGHAFLIPIKDVLADDEETAFHKLIGVFQNKIIPLLQEYFFEDWQKIRLVLGDNQKPANLQFVTEEKLTSSKLDALFGTGHGLNQYGDEQHRYALQLFSKPVWQDPQAYLGIYSKVANQKLEPDMNQAINEITAQ